MMHRSMDIPDGDVLIHTGDFTNHGSLDEVKDFASWLSTLPHRIKIIVPGNHDMILDAAYYEQYWSDWSGVKESPTEALGCLAAVSGCHVLIDRGILLILAAA